MAAGTPPSPMHSPQGASPPAGVARLPPRRHHEAAYERMGIRTLYTRGQQQLLSRFSAVPASFSQHCRIWRGCGRSAHGEGSGKGGVGVALGVAVAARLLRLRHEQRRQLRQVLRLVRQSFRQLAQRLGGGEARREARGIERRRRVVRGEGGAPRAPRGVGGAGDVLRLVPWGGARATRLWLWVERERRGVQPQRRLEAPSQEQRLRGEGEEGGGGAEELVGCVGVALARECAGAGDQRRGHSSSNMPKPMRNRCARACLSQPLCEAATWFPPTFTAPALDVRRLRAACVGRTAGTPAAWRRTGEPGCGLQASLDALCASRNASGAWCGAAVARNTRGWRGVEDFAWACVASPPRDAPLELACVDDRGQLALCRVTPQTLREGSGVTGRRDCCPSPLAPPSPLGSPRCPTATKSRAACRVECMAISAALHDAHRAACTARLATAEWLRWYWAAWGAPSPRERRGGAHADVSWWRPPSPSEPMAGGRGREEPRHRQAGDLFDLEAFLGAMQSLASKRVITASFGESKRKHAAWFISLVGDSTIRPASLPFRVHSPQQAVSLCCLLTAASRATASAAPSIRVDIDRSVPHAKLRCNVLQRQPSGDALLGVVTYRRTYRMDSLSPARPSEINPRLPLALQVALAAKPHVLLTGPGGWEFEEGCDDRHTLHDALCNEQRGNTWLQRRPWVLSDFATRWALVLEAINANVPPADRASTLVLMRTPTPRDFEPVDVMQGGSCSRLQPMAESEVQEGQAVDATSMRFAELSKAAILAALVVERAPWVRMLDAYAIARLRADSHVGLPPPCYDCVHFCLPGIPDVFNGRLLTLLQHQECRRSAPHIPTPAPSSIQCSPPYTPVSAPLPTPRHAFPICHPDPMRAPLPPSRPFPCVLLSSIHPLSFSYCSFLQSADGSSAAASVLARWNPWWHGVEPLVQRASHTPRGRPSTAAAGALAVQLRHDRGVPPVRLKCTAADFVVDDARGQLGVCAPTSDPG
ncbi:hypothetical protein AB1Y20_012306 [Prymnesium parvum]|uniref:Trichome birefringence-like C-terminal domain-containing protein n=1 Tax=Prymnesium parvum TaxID=97485 RepID=A0AB34IP28_PRYPA